MNIYTARPDTIYGATFIALSVNHPIVKKYLKNNELDEIKKNFTNSEQSKEKIGIPLNIDCDHPILDKKLPVFIANFVLDNCREGAIFGCPAHDGETTNLQKNIISQS